LIGWGASSRHQVWRSYAKLSDCLIDKSWRLPQVLLSAPNESPTSFPWSKKKSATTRNSVFGQAHDTTHKISSVVPPCLEPFVDILVYKLSLFVSGPLVAEDSKLVDRLWQSQKTTVVVRNEQERSHGLELAGRFS
jgi:hypothetical protein